MKHEAIIDRCELVLAEALDELIAEGRAADLAKRLDVVTKAVRYLESVTPKQTVVRHTYDSHDERPKQPEAVDRDNGAAGRVVPPASSHH